MYQGVVITPLSSEMPLKSHEYRGGIFPTTEYQLVCSQTLKANGSCSFLLCISEGHHVEVIELI